MKTIQTILDKKLSYSGTYKTSILTIKELYFGRKKDGDKLLCISCYQRGDVHSFTFVDKLLDSIINGIPLNSIYLHYIGKRKDGKTIYCLVDGRQRTSAMVKIIENPFEFQVFNDIIIQATDNIKDDFDDKSKSKTLGKNLRLICKEIKNKNMIELTENYKKVHKEIMQLIKLNSDDLVDYLKTTVNTILKELFDLYSKVLNSEVNIYELNGNEEYIMKVFKRTSRSGIPLTKVDIIASVWSKLPFITSANPEIEKIMKKKKEKIVEGDDLIVEYEVNKKNYSCYMYLLSLDAYLTSKIDFYRFYRKKTELKDGSNDGPSASYTYNFELITKIIMNIFDLSSIDDIPQLLQNQFKEDKLACFEKHLMDIMESINNFLFDFIHFTSTKGNNFLSINSILALINHAKNESIMNKLNNEDFCYKILCSFVINKIDNSNYDSFDINTFIDVPKIKDIIGKYAESSLNDEKREPTINDKSLLFLAYIKTKNEDINKDDFHFDHVIAKSLLDKTKLKLNISHIGNLVCLPSKMNLCKSTKNIADFVKENSKGKYVRKQLFIDVDKYDQMIKLINDKTKKNSVKTKTYNELMCLVSNKIADQISLDYRECLTDDDLIDNDSEDESDSELDDIDSNDEHDYINDDINNISDDESDDSEEEYDIKKNKNAYK